MPGSATVRSARSSTSSSSASRRSARRRSSSDNSPNRSASGNNRRSALSCRSSSLNSAREVKSRYGSSTPRCTRSSTSTPTNAVSRDSITGSFSSAQAAALSPANHLGRLLPRTRSFRSPGRPGTVRALPAPQGWDGAGRREIVVLDRITRPRHPRMLQPWHRPEKGQLHRRWQGGGEPVDVHLGCVEPLRLQENLMPNGLGKLDDLVLDRRAVARPAPADGAAVQRGLLKVSQDDSRSASPVRVR